MFLKFQNISRDFYRFQKILKISKISGDLKIFKELIDILRDWKFKKIYIDFKRFLEIPGDFKKFQVISKKF